MADLGTLWFGADIDLSKLQQKIASGNQSILDSLKISYDPQSYNQMVTKLKAQLDNEIFKIKISTDTSAVRQNLQNTLNNVSSGLSTPKIDMSQLKGIPAMTRDILDQKEAIRDNAAEVFNLRKAWKDMITQHGRSSQQAKDAFKEYDKARTRLVQANYILKGMNIERSKATLAQSELNKQMKESSKIAKQWNSDSLRLNATLAGGIHVSTQLGSALSSLFAIDYARQFLGNVIEIGGQLEKQRISIGAILGDTVKASHLFEQIKGLALKSPFGVVELDQYTKQLSAYGFKYNELFDMTKRLADISAGAGTDIGRLTLALGHVRSATYLTGITLRQFSMNNIPMLKMLADYYSEVEKKAVSTAEVQQRISKRQVSYEDVIEQIRRLTDEGGMFYNMQEKISESLAAKFKNLRDAMDIMYGEMAESFVGDMLKGLAEQLLKLTRSWKSVAASLVAATLAFYAGKAIIGLNTIALKGNTASTLKQIMATKQLEANNLRASMSYRQLTAEERMKVIFSKKLIATDIRKALATEQLTRDEVLNAIAMRKVSDETARALVRMNLFSKAEIDAALNANVLQTRLSAIQLRLKNMFAGIGMGTWASLGLIAGSYLFTAYNEWKDRIEEKAKEMTDNIKSRLIDLEKMQKTINNEGKPKDQTALKGRVDEMKQVLANSEAYTKTLDEQLSKSNTLSGQYDILAETIDKVAEKNHRMLDAQSTAASLIEASSFGNKEWWDIGKWGDTLFNDDIKGNIEDVNEAYKQLRSTLSGLYEFKEPIKELIESMMKSGEVSEGLKNQLKNSPFEEQVRLLVENGYWDELNTKITEAGRHFKMTEDEISDVSKRLKEGIKGVSDEWGEVIGDDIPKMFARLVKEQGGSEEKTRQWCIDNIEDFKMLMDGILDQLDEKEPSIRNSFKRIFYDYVRFKNLSEGIGEGAKIGASMFNADFGEEEQASIKEESSSPKKEGKKDKQLEAAKTKLQEYKAFLSEYKKYREIYTKEKAINLLEGLFPNLKGKGTEIVDNYIELLDKLKISTEKNAEARKKYNNELDKTKAETRYDREKKAMKDNADAMKEYVKKIEDQWKLYRSLLDKSGGNRDFASMAFDEAAIWDETAKKLLEKFNERGKELGVVPVYFNWNLNEQGLKEALVDADGKIQEEMVELAKKIQSIITGNYTKFLEDTAEAYRKSLTTAEKLADIENQLQQKKQQRDTDNNQSPQRRAQWDVQIKALEKERNKLKSQLENETGEILQFYSAIFSMTSGQAEAVGLKIKQNLVEKLQEGEISGEQYLKEIKRIDAQMDKMRRKKSIFEIFRSSGFKGVAEFKLEIADDNLTNASNRLLEANDRLKVAMEGLSKAKSTGDEIKITDAKVEVAEAERGVADAKMEHDTAVVNQQQARKQLKNTNKFSNTVAAFAYLIQVWVQAYNDLKDAAASYGENLDANLSSEGQYIMGIMQGLNTGISRLQSGDVIGALTGMFFGSISSIAKMHDETLKEDQKNSELIVKSIDNMRESIERALERTLGGIYTTKADDKVLKYFYDYINRVSKYDTIEEKIIKEFKKAIGGRSKARNRDTQNAIDTALRTEEIFDIEIAQLYVQRDELIRQLEDEKEKKNKDESAILDYKQSIEEIEDEIKHFAEDMAKSLYDIDIKSWASELGDALFEAWQKGESGADAFKKKASEIIAELSKNIAVTKLIETSLQPVLNTVVSEMERTKGRLDEHSIEDIARQMELVGETLPDSFNALMDGINEGIKKAGLTDLKELANDSSSATQNGIGKEITEQDTTLWASYLNAIRLDVSVIRSTEALHLPQISLDVHNVSTLAETQVQHLQHIADNTKRNADAADKIYDIIHRIETGATKLTIK